eukprot:9993083-Ditylum_brightwellii.AAC.1
MGAVDETYLLSLKNQYTGYVQSTTIAILQHLYATYGRITPTKLDKNDKAMKKDYDATLPIEHLAEQIETAVTIAGNTNQPYTAAQVLSIAYNLIFKTGVYKDACKEWRNMVASDKTWPNFKRHFAAAYADNLEETTATGIGYGANAVHQQQDLTNALEHLANAALSDRAALTNLTQANLTL